MLFPKDNSDDLSKVSFMRAARTDKGVHAAGNVISLKLVIEDPDIVKKVNAILPPTIRIWGYVRTLRSFHSKNMCDSRIYEYLIPSYVFLSPKKTTCMGSMLGRLRGSETNDPDSAFLEQEEKKKTYRISKEKLAAIRGAFNVYIGTHNFSQLYSRKELFRTQRKSIHEGYHSRRAQIDRRHRMAQYKVYTGSRSCCIRFARWSD